MMKSWKQWAPAFAAGLLAGVLLTCGASKMAHRPFRDPEHRRQHILERFSRKLALTPEQKTKVAAILEEKGTRMEALWGESKTKFESLRNETSAQIRALLTPEQQAKFDVLQKKMAERWKKRGERWGS